MSSLSRLANTPRPRAWVNRTVVGIVLATFFSDVGHEMCTAVLPLYLSAVGLGPAALGLMEGLADFLFSLSKLVGGIVGHRVQAKRPWTALGYLMTALGTAAIGFAQALVGVASLRAVAWFGRGFRSPLRDYLLADAVESTHFGRAYGIERAADMLGAVAGPLLAVLLVWSGVHFRTIILWTILPASVPVLAILLLIREGAAHVMLQDVPVRRAERLPRSFWWFVGGVSLFGLGDFSRTFLIWLAARSFGEHGLHGGALSLAVLLYAVHNAVSAVAAYPAGRRGDRGSKLHVLIGGYALGVLTNILLAVLADSSWMLVVPVVFSGIYIAVEETLEKAVAAELLPRPLRSLGFGILACANAVGDMVSSLYVGYLLGNDQAQLAFGLAAALGALGVAWTVIFLPRLQGPKHG